MSKVWFTSDTHFGHAKSLTYCTRPFSTVEEMDDVAKYMKQRSFEQVDHHRERERLTYG